MATRVFVCASIGGKKSSAAASVTVSDTVRPSRDKRSSSVEARAYVTRYHTLAVRALPYTLIQPHCKNRVRVLNVCVPICTCRVRAVATTR